MNTLSAVSPLKYSEKELLAFLLSGASDRGQSAALWRLPNSPVTQLLISEKDTVLDPGEFLEELDPGFLFAPFKKVGEPVVPESRPDVYIRERISQALNPHGRKFDPMAEGSVSLLRGRQIQSANS